MSDRASRERDAEARRHAVNPAENVVLEASAGTGKTHVLVDRYVRLLLAGVEPEHILAITFTRKAAAEMRQRIIKRLGAAPEAHVAERWRALRPRLDAIEISTIDAFCLALLREFPLEADVDPGFELAGEADLPRLVDEALDSALRISRRQAVHDDDVALVFARLGERRLREGLAGLLDRRLVAPDALHRFLARGPRDLTSSAACALAAERLASALRGVTGELDAFVADGPVARSEFTLIARDMRRLVEAQGPPDSRASCAALRAAVERLRGYFLTLAGEPRGEHFLGSGFSAADCVSDAAWRRHRTAAAALAPAVGEAVRAFRRDLNVVLSRGVSRVFAVALSEYERTLESHALLDFPGVLARALNLLRQMDEFARSRFRLEARYHHVLVDEFQDTSRAQWELVAQLVRSWGEGLGASADAIQPSIFIVGDRKQSIYGFRDADPGMLREAADFVERLRPEGQSRHAISVSFRAVPELLRFVNDVFSQMAAQGEGDGLSVRRDAFKYEPHDWFPLPAAGPEPARPDADDVPVGIVVGASVPEVAEAVGDEIARVLSGAVVRDRDTGVRRPARAGDIAILFRSRDGHREFEAALERRGVSTYVYKGLGFFAADEVQDVVALLRFLADPSSNLRAAAFLRSRFVRLSDEGLARLAPELARRIVGQEPPASVDRLSAEDGRVLACLRAATAGWLALVDRVTPTELLDVVLEETAYALEMAGPRRLQARENLKKLRAFVRRIQNRGYATLARVTGQLERLSLGDESNATIDAAGAVSLMTVHAAKGLEFPIVFVVNIGRGAGGARAPVRVALGGDGEPSVAVADYQSDADQDERDREREETKRLLYVAMTRARDRLYLSATAVDEPGWGGPGSLGEVLPPSLKKVFTEAAALGVSASGAAVTWPAESGAPHRCAVVRRGSAPPERAVTPRDAIADTVGAGIEDDFVALDDSGGVRRVAAVQYVQPERLSPQRPHRARDASSRRIGILAHQLFPSGGEPAAMDRLRAEPAVRLGRTLDHQAVIARASALAARLRGDPRVAARLASGRAWYEVPFSVWVDRQTVVRGVIDCLVRGEDGRVTVIELKTGPMRPEHEAQLALYVAAMQGIFVGSAVEGLLVHAAES